MGAGLAMSQLTKVVEGWRGGGCGTPRPDDLNVLLDHAEVLVIGNASEEAALAVVAAGPNHVVSTPRGAQSSSGQSQIQEARAGV